MSLLLSHCLCLYLLSCRYITVDLLNVVLIRCRFSQILAPIYEEAAVKVVQEFPVSSFCSLVSIGLRLDSRLHCDMELHLSVVLFHLIGSFVDGRFVLALEHSVAVSVFLRIFSTFLPHAND